MSINNFNFRRFVCPFTTADPKEPYPIIQNCVHEETEEENCNISVSSPVNISCSIHEYFPHVTLYFRHKEQNLESTISFEQNNADGTKNKSITVIAVASDFPYICVASDIPGSESRKKENNIYVNEIPLESTTDEAVVWISTESGSGGGRKARTIGR